MKEDIFTFYKNICKEYKLSSYEIRKLWSLINPICEHEEFIKRCSAPYFHHGTKTLGEHILRDAIVTFKMVRNIKSRSHNLVIKLDTAVYIAMFHDLYEIPWQNSFQNKKFPNKHGFVHPIEAIVNAITWYPEYFASKNNALMIIDGVLHHMYPLAVRSVDGTDLELNNIKKYEALPEKYKNMIKAATNNAKFGPFSMRKSFFLEGRIMSKADKAVALKKEIKDVNSYMALINGYNKKIDFLYEN